MAGTTYRFTLKSEEQRGAAQPNILRINLDSDADADTFASNLQAICSAEVASIDTVISQDYTLPYPAGTGVTARMAMFGEDFTTHNQHLREWAVGADPDAMAQALLAGGILLPNGALPAPTAINVLVTRPGQFF
jgi:hypothetical protein